MRSFLVIIWGLVIAGCREKYDPPVISNGVSYLVVDGLINSGEGATHFNLSCTVKLTDTTVVKPELNAQITIQGENNITYPVYETGGGTYSAGQILLDNTIKYNVYIKTSDGKEYASDWVTIKQTPGIDSISWKKNNDAIEVSVSAHDAQNATRYYRWEYTETWEYRSPYESFLKYENDNLVKRDAASNVYRCWHIVSSTNILLGSSEKLAQDVMDHYHLLDISKNSEKIGFGYSILVKQFALTKEAYDFWTNLKKNTEQLGSIFDAQPSELTGNIHCLTNIHEPVIGFISASSEEEKRIFITTDALYPWAYVPNKQECIMQVVKDDSLKYYFGTFGSIYTPLDSVFALGVYVGVDGTYAFCADCTLHGGTNLKPSYWP